MSILKKALFVTLPLLGACASVQAPSPTRSVTLQFDLASSPVGAPDMDRLLTAVAEVVSSELPVNIVVLPAIERPSGDVCVVRFGTMSDVLGSGWGVGLSATGSAYWTGEQVYPCRITIRDYVTEQETVMEIVKHEVGHILLNQTVHSEDPQSIMGNDCCSGRDLAFTKQDASVYYRKP